MLNKVAPGEKLVNGGAPFNMSTELASRVAPLANRENGGRRGTVQRNYLKPYFFYSSKSLLKQ
jgi:hypothetical protein